MLNGWVLFAATEHGAIWRKKKKAPKGKMYPISAAFGKAGVLSNQTLSVTTRKGVKRLALEMAQERPRKRGKKKKMLSSIVDMSAVTGIKFVKRRIFSEGSLGKWYNKSTNRSEPRSTLGLDHRRRMAWVFPWWEGVAW